MQTSGVVEYASPSTQPKSQRLLSLDVFRGLVILAMLIVNNIGDNATTGYFWKHADWPGMTWGQAWKTWWGYTIHPPDPQKRLRELEDEMEPYIMAGTFSGMFESEAARRRWETNASFASVKLQALDEEMKLCVHPWRRIPLFTRCTLADYVMPWFMLIIGVAIPFSVAASTARGVSKQTMWLRTIRRAGMLVVLGWILCFFRDHFVDSLYGNAPWSFTLGMDVLQLLGMGYLFARILYELPIKPRAVLAGLLLVGHWALLRFYSQGDVPRGTFNQHFDAIGYIYDHWNTQNIGPIAVSFRGLLSIPPAAATMVIGTLVGDALRAAPSPLYPGERAGERGERRHPTSSADLSNDVADPSPQPSPRSTGEREQDARANVRRLVAWGMLMTLAGFLWAFDLPFNKPRWTPSYLLYTSGVGTVLLAVLYYLIDVKHRRRWTYPLVVFGTNAIALYFLSILAKVLLLNTPRVSGWAVIDVILSTLKNTLGPWAGGWTFTVLFIAIWWVILDQMYRRKIFWKL